ncbi:uncharacterized protein east isoform X2 [Periplaneta americana]|uniref:uncharacterized protein east isoform X2 n=1 Tax=Periplaneta americana TaxID=6978 RepID=UPI0037E9C3FD
MAGREKKQLGNKQLGVRKETDKAAESQKDEAAPKTRESKQVQKDVIQGKRSIPNRRSTGGIKSRKSAGNVDVSLKNRGTVGVETAAGRKSIPHVNSERSPKLRQASKLNKLGRSRSETNLASQVLPLSGDTKRSQSPRLSNVNKVSKGGKTGRKTEETNLADGSNNVQTTKTQNAKLKRFGKLNKLGTSSSEIRNGTKGRNAPYITRSDSPARVLRNGKRRRLKDPSLLEGLDVGYTKRRRLHSTTRDGSGSEMGCKSEPCLDDQSSIAGSDISFYDSPRLENGKTNWDSDCDSKTIVDDPKQEEISTQGVQSALYPDNQSDTTLDTCLGKSISNKIAELINRNKFLESIGKEITPKVDGKPASTKSSESVVTNTEKLAEAEKKLTDTNSNVCGPEPVPPEKTTKCSAEHKDLSEHNAKWTPSSYEKTEAKEKVLQLVPASSKVNVQDSAELKELEHKNGQNPSIDIPLNAISDKSKKKIKELKNIKSKTNFFQACPSSSGVFYVVQNTKTVPFRKGELRSEENQTAEPTNPQPLNIDSKRVNSSIPEEQFAQNSTSHESKSDITVGKDEPLHDKRSTVPAQMSEGDAELSSVKDSVSGGNVECFSVNVDNLKCNNSDGNSLKIIDNRRNSVNKIESDDSVNKVESDVKIDSSAIRIDPGELAASKTCEDTCNVNNSEDSHMEGTDTTSNEFKNYIPKIDYVCDDPVVQLEHSVTDVKTVDIDEVSSSNVTVDSKIDNVQSADESDNNACLHEVVQKFDVKDAPHVDQTLESVSDGDQKTSVLTEVTVKNQALCTEYESETFDGSKSATSLSVDKVQVANNCFKSTKEEKSVKANFPVKKHDVIKDESELLSLCLAEDDCTMECDDAAFSAKIISETEEKNVVEVMDIEKSETKADELPMDISTNSLIAQSITPEENVCADDVSFMEVEKQTGKQLIKTGENEVNLDSKEEEEIKNSYSDTKILQSSADSGAVVEEEKISFEGIEVPTLKSDDLNDVIESVEAIINKEDSLAVGTEIEKEDQISNITDLCGKSEEMESATNLPVESEGSSEVLTELKKDEANTEDEKETCKLQNGIEPILFYSKEKLKDSEVPVCDSEVKLSDILSEESCDSKNSKHEPLEGNEVTSDGFMPIIPECSKEVVNSSDDSKLLSSEVFQNDAVEEKCDDSVSKASAVESKCLSNVSVVLHDLKQQLGDSFAEVSSSIDSGVVDSSPSLDAAEKDSKIIDSENVVTEGEEVSPEEQAIKETVLSALGLQPLRTLQTGTSENSKDPFAFGSRKCLKPTYSYRSFDTGSQSQVASDNISNDPASPEASCKDDTKSQSTKQSTNLVIPEKSSSFSIHPGRLCSDVCSYCFGKFGSLDTPCHVAQLKSTERQQKILQAETHLTADSCLCDACFRHVDRKANCPSYKPKKRGQHHRSTAALKSVCCVQGCSQIAHHHVRRKWLIKLKRSIAKKVPIDMDKMPQHLPFPLCPKHYSWVDYFMVCGICKRRLTRNHMYPLGPEVHELNTALASDGIPVQLSDKLFLCKLCRYFSSVRLKYKDPSLLAGNHKLFFQGYRKRILHFHDIEDVDDETTEESPRRKKVRKSKISSTTVRADSEDDSGTKSKYEPSSQSEEQPGDTFSTAVADVNHFGDTPIDRSGASTPMIDYSSLGNGTSTSNTVSFDDVSSSRKQSIKLERVKPTKLKFKLSSGGKIGSLAYSHSDGQNSGPILLPERDGLEVTPVHDSLSRPFYPGQEELPLHADFEFHGKKQEENVNKRTDWEKCTATIQFDKDTKSLFQQLQRPYGNHSSFFRHLILLEKYWRSGELTLAPNATSRAMNYINSVQNRIRAYEGHSSSSFVHLSSPFSSASHSATISPAPPTTPVPIIDLPLKRKTGGGVAAGPDGPSRSITITGMSGMSISPRPVTFSSVSTISPSAVSSTQSRMPVFTSFSHLPTSSASRKVVVDTTATSSSSGSHFQQNRRIPNILQVTAGGKSFSIVPGLSQIRQIQAIHQQQFQKQQQQQQQKQHSPSPTFEPMICDVRSLATENGSSLWEKNVTHPSSKSSMQPQPNISVSFLPKTNSTVQSSAASLKPCTIVTPTGIILSRKPEISVTAVTEKREVSLKPKVISSRKESVSKVKTVSELMKVKPILEKKEMSVSDIKDSLPKTKC